MFPQTSHLYNFLALDIVNRGNVGWDAGVFAAAPQRACQLPDRLATELGGDVFGV